MHVSDPSWAYTAEHVYCIGPTFVFDICNICMHLRVELFTFFLSTSYRSNFILPFPCGWIFLKAENKGFPNKSPKQQPQATKPRNGPSSGYTASFENRFS
jgi:hypothetical protein